MFLIIPWHHTDILEHDGEIQTWVKWFVEPPGCLFSCPYRPQSWIMDELLMITVTDYHQLCCLQQHRFISPQSGGQMDVTELKSAPTVPCSLGGSGRGPAGRPLAASPGLMAFLVYGLVLGLQSQWHRFFPLQLFLAFCWASQACFCSVCRQCCPPPS